MSSRKSNPGNARGNGDVKRAIREVMDEMITTYARGAAKFGDAVTTSLARIGDSFDDFFTENLIEDRPEAAIFFLDARLRSARETQKLLHAKISALEGLRAKTIARERKRGGRKAQGG